jgi:hypothetical protein
MKWEDERLEAVPCGRVSCCNYDENYVQSCQLGDDEPHATVCHKYFPVGEDK